MTKKSFLEKLGIIEPVEDVNTEENKEFMIDAEELDAFMDDAVDSFELKQEITSIEEAVVAKVDEEYAIELDRLVMESQDASVSLAIEETLKDQEIEDKLNVLIGAYEKNKLVTIEEIYRNARLNHDIKKTIFIADVFQKTLPENLPLDIKRDSVLGILNVSGIGTEELLTDAYQRIDSLNTILESTVNTTEEILVRNEASIRELEKRIEDLKKVIEDRRKFNEDQNTLIEYEVQKIINIVDFIKPKK